MEVDLKVRLKRYFWGFNGTWKAIPLESVEPEVVLDMTRFPVITDGCVKCFWDTGPDRLDYRLRVIRGIPQRKGRDETIRIVHISSRWHSSEELDWMIFEVPKTFPTPKSGRLPKAFVVENTLYVPYEWTGQKFHCFVMDFRLRDDILQEQFPEDSCWVTAGRILCTPPAVVLDIAGFAVLVPWVVIGTPFALMFQDSQEPSMEIILANMMEEPSDAETIE